MQQTPPAAPPSAPAAPAPLPALPTLGAAAIMWGALALRELADSLGPDDGINDSGLRARARDAVVAAAVVVHLRGLRRARPTMGPLSELSIVMDAASRACPDGALREVMRTASLVLLFPPAHPDHVALVLGLDGTNEEEQQRVRLTREIAARMLAAHVCGDALDDVDRDVAARDILEHFVEEILDAGEDEGGGDLAEAVAALLGHLQKELQRLEREREGGLADPPRWPRPSADPLLGRARALGFTEIRFTIGVAWSDGLDVELGLDGRRLLINPSVDRADFEQGARALLDAAEAGRLDEYLRSRPGLSVVQDHRDRLAAHPGAAECRGPDGNRAASASGGDHLAPDHTDGDWVRRRLLERIERLPTSTLLERIGDLVERPS